MDLHSYDLDVPLEGLAEEARRAMADWDWSRGAYGHALSLPDYGQLHPSRRYQYENFPCAGLLGDYPLFSRVFEGFDCDKVSFRLLRRGPKSSYAWHTDSWRGPGVVRLQVPVISDDTAFLVTTDYDAVDEVRGASERLSAESFDAFAEANAGHFSRHHLTPGRLHYFDTTRVHTLVNPGPGERVTLTVDLVVNDWVLERYPEVRAEIGDGAVEPLPSPGRVRGGLAFARSRLYPVRNRARRLLAS